MKMFKCYIENLGKIILPTQWESNACLIVHLIIYIGIDGYVWVYMGIYGYVWVYMGMMIFAIFAFFNFSFKVWTL